MTRSLVFVLSCLLTAGAAPFASPLKAQPRPMTVDDVLAIERLDRASVSPDGALVAAVVLRGALPGETYGRISYEVDPSRADVWIVDRATGAKRNLTQGRALAAGAWCATWSPDGQRLAFLSTRPEAQEPRGGDNVRLYMWDRKTDRVRRIGYWPVVTQTRYGGTIRKLDIAGARAAAPDPCTVGDENSPFAWLDQRRLIVAMLPAGRISGVIDASDRTYRHTQATRAAIRAGSDVMVSASGSGTERTTAVSDDSAILAIVDTELRTRTDIATVPAYPFNGSLGVRVSPDGRRAAVLATIGAIPPRAGIAWPRNDGDWMVEKKLGLVDIARDRPIKWVTLPASARLPVALEGWSGDGRTIAFTARARPQDQSTTRYSIDRSATTATPLAAAQGAAAPARPTGLPPRATLLASDGEGLVWSETTLSGTFVRALPTAGGTARDLLALNRHIAKVDPGRTSMFDYVGSDGTPLKAAVLLPPHYRPGERLPVIMWVYGGYSVRGAEDDYLDRFMPGIYNMRLYAARGYAVLIPSMPLRRDGTQDHLMALAPSALPALDKLVAMGIADPARVGVMGQSYGGYTALGLATQSDRFKAVVAIAPISDLAAYHGAFDVTARGYPGIEHEKSANPLITEVGVSALQLPPYADPDRYRRNSPLSFVDRVTAKVLLIHGEQDLRGSMFQSEAFFTALWRQGKTARILRYWGEDHSIASSPATVRNVVDEIIGWFDKYLAPTDARPAR